ncbi:MAG TPA: ankyrin repeat domain-containing protein [Terriglobales bacterium]|nr:ankyrin repeat domain-containing protein [Terriglobales bacterium]
MYSIRLFVVVLFLSGLGLPQAGGMKTNGPDQQPIVDQKVSSAQKDMLSAIRDGRIEVVHQLILEGEDPNFTITLGPDCFTTPLMEAVADQRSDIVSLLLDKGANINFASKQRCGGVLEGAAWNGDSDMVQTLIGRGAEVDSRDGDGMTPLLVAASNAGNIATIQVLIKAGADVHATDNEGDTALMLAAWDMNEAAVQLFLKLGLRRCDRNKLGETAFDRAKIVIGGDQKKKARVLQLLSPVCPKETAKSNNPKHGLRYSQLMVPLLQSKARR